MERNQWKNRAVYIAVVTAMAMWAIIGVDADSHGAPLSSCEKMGAVHAVFPSQPADTCPFGITFDKTEIMNGETLGITLSAKTGSEDVEIKRGPALPGYFTGFLVMGFDADNKDNGPIGHFSAVDAAKGQFLDCFNLTRSAVTHVNPNFKPHTKVEWNPPEDWSGSVLFRASFTANIATIWAKIPSAIISVVNATRETTPEPETTTTPTTTTPPTTTNKNETTPEPETTTTSTTTTPPTTTNKNETTPEPETTTTSTTTTPLTTPKPTTISTEATTPASAGHLSGSWMLTIFAIALASTPFLV